MIQNESSVPSRPPPPRPRFARPPLPQRGEERMVGLVGLEPTTPASQTQCATKLRHSPYRLSAISHQPSARRVGAWWRCACIITGCGHLCDDGRCPPSQSVVAWPARTLLRCRRREPMIRRHSLAGNDPPRTPPAPLRYTGGERRCRCRMPKAGCRRPMADRRLSCWLPRV